MLLADETSHEVVLHPRESDPVDPYALETGVLEEAAPPASHVEHVHSRMETQRIDGVLHLAGLRSFGSVVRQLVQTMGVGTPSLQPREKELRRLIVVKRDAPSVEPAAAGQPELEAEGPLRQPTTTHVEDIGEPHDLGRVALDVDSSLEIVLRESLQIAASERRDCPGGVQRDARPFGTLTQPNSF